MKIHGISHILLDLEGTTCPVSFVSGTLFPYASSHLPGFLKDHQNDAQVAELMAGVQEAWKQDSHIGAQQLLAEKESRTVDYLQLLIKQDRKLTELKELQGLIWAEGYQSGELVGPLYDDVAPALRHWHQQGLVLGVYSSGSVAAQQLIYKYSNAGDLRSLFSHWFDTRTGAKQEVGSYQAIAKAMQVEGEKVLFISDSQAECTAAKTVGMAVLFSEREGNQSVDGGYFECIRSFEKLELEP